jgi:MarR family transcriptional regulator, temperature-dependent positive regulator of motility
VRAPAGATGRPSGGMTPGDPASTAESVTARAQQSGTIVLLNRLARAIYLASSVDLVGMNLRNMVVLAYLRDHPSVSQQAMTEHLSMDSNTGVLVLNDLEDLEYVERRRDPADRRRHIVEITAAGLEALEIAEVAQGTIEDEILGGLSQAERAELRRLLLQALEDHDLGR